MKFSQICMARAGRALSSAFGRMKRLAGRVWETLSRDGLRLPARSNRQKNGAETLGKRFQARASRVLDRMKADFCRAIPGFRAAWDKFGYYISLALLLALLGTAAHAYRGNNSSSPVPQATVAPEPAVVISGPAETPAPEEPQSPLFTRPLEGEIVKGYSVDRMEWSDTLEQWQIHPGVDIVSPQGCVVYAAANGVVKSAYKDPLMGNVIVLSHADGYETVYMGLKTLSLVESGQEVEQGQAISSVGDTAVAEQEFGSHLHYEIWLNGVALEPDFAGGDLAN